MATLKQSTSATITVGPVLDADGVAVTDIAVGDLKVSKAGAAPAALNGSATLDHRHTGHYSLALTATDTNTVGTLEVVIDDTVNAMPIARLDVIEEAVYDDLYAASAAGYNTTTPPTAVENREEMDSNSTQLAKLVDQTTIPNVLYVSKSGDDSSDGSSWTDAKLTVGAAVTAATDGDTIAIAAGVYEESVDASSLTEITIVSQNYAEIKETAGTAHALQIGSYTTLRGLKITSSVETSDKAALVFHDTAGVRIDNCHVSGFLDGLQGDRSTDFIFSNSHFEGTYDGGRLPGVDRYVIDGCTFRTTGAFFTASPGFYTARALTIPYDASVSTRTMSGVIKDSQFIIDRSVAQASKETIALEVNGSPLLQNNTYIARLTDTTPDNDVIALSHTATGVAGTATVIGGTAWTSNATGGDSFDVRNIGGTLVVAGLGYDRSKTSGAIRDDADAIVTDTADLQANQGNWLTATGFSTHSATDVWAAATRTLSAGTKDTEIDAILTDTADMQPKLGTIQDLGNGATVGDNLRDMAGATFATGTDSLEEIIDRGNTAWITGSGGSGSGARTVTITVDDGTDPLQNATVRMTEGANTFTATTNVSGVATFNLDDATYTVSITKAGYSYDGTTLVVNGTEVETYSMTAVTITASSPGFTTGYITAYNPTGSAEQSVEASILITDAPSGTGSVFEGVVRTATSDVNGLIQFAGIPRLAQFVFRRGCGAWSEKQTAEDAATFEIDNWIGKDE